MKIIKDIKNINIFTLLVILASLSLVFRLNSFIYNGKMTSIITAQAVEKVNNEPPSFAPTKTETDNKPLAGDNYKNPYGNANLSAHPTRFSDTEIQVLQSLSKRRKTLDKREQQIARREALLSATEKEVNQKISELKKIRTDIEKLLGKQSNVQEANMRSLVKIYSSMKPKDAARILNTLEMKVLLDVLGRMSERKTAPILANMDADRAREVTLELAKQRELPLRQPQIEK